MSNLRPNSGYAAEVILRAHGIRVHPEPAQDVFTSNRATWSGPHPVRSTLRLRTFQPSLPSIAGSQSVSATWRGPQRADIEQKKKSLIDIVGHQLASPNPSRAR